MGFILIIQGTPMGFDSKMTIPTLEGAEQTVSQGPTAAIVPIKQLGTNGGGYFGVNSSHPLENPTYLTNIIECLVYSDHSDGIGICFGILSET